MQANRIGTLGLFCFLCTSAWGVTPALPDRNSYAALPCANEAEFQSLATEARLTRRPEGALCDDSRLARLGKLLKLTKAMRVPPPPGWQGGAAPALSDPMAYLTRMNTLVDLDFAQATTIAYNRGREVYLGALFFELAPLDALVTLVHETRHSATEDPGHTRCLQGDIAHAPGGCDEWFRVDENAGAYAYNVSYALGLVKYAPLSVSNREYLAASALATIGTRFNRVPEWLATPVDVVMALDEGGGLHALHPFLGTLIPVAARIADDKIARIEFNDWNNGLRLFTDRGRAHIWRPGRAPWRWASDRIADTVKLVDVGGWNNGSHTYAYYLADDNQLSYLSVDPQTGKRKVFASALKLGDIVGRRLVHGGTDRRYVHASDGKLHYYDPAGAGSFPESIFRVQGGWTHVTSGVLYSDIFGIDRSGSLFYKTEQGPVRSPLQAERGGLKYVEGTTLRALLDRDGNLVVARHGAQQAAKRVLAGPRRIVDVAIIRNYRAAHGLMVPPAGEDPFARACGLVTAGKDPWLHRGIGLDARGRLVLEGDARESCATIPAGDSTDGWTSISFPGSAVTASGHPFSRSVLRLQGPRGSRDIAPY